MDAEKNDDLLINVDVKHYLNWLSREYEFHYMFSGEKYGLVNNLNILKKPVLILGPEDASEKYEGKMRRYSSYVIASTSSEYFSRILAGPPVYPTPSPTPKKK